MLIYISVLNWRIRVRRKTQHFQGKGAVRSFYMGEQERRAEKQERRGVGSKAVSGFFG